MVDALAPQFQLLIRIMEDEISEQDEKKQNEILLQKFNPTNLKPYQQTIASLGKLAHSTPEPIIDSLLELYSILIFKGEPSLYAVLLQSTQFMRSNNEISKKLCLAFGLFMTTDLLLTIIQNSGTCGKSAILAENAYKLCDPNLQIKISVNIIFSWSSVLAFASMDNFQDASEKFFSLVDKCDNDKLFILISKLRLDAVVDLGIHFLENLVNVLKTMQRKKQLTNSILFAVAHLVSSVNFPCDELQKLYNIILYERDSKLKDGVYYLTVALFPHLPNMESKANAFFRKRVYAHADDPKKVERSLRLFWNRMMGGYYSLSVEEDLFFIGRTGESAKEMAPIFMKVFFKKSDFSACPKMFSNVLIHLASIDFQYFVREMLPSFMQLHLNDPRLIVLLSIIPKINSDNFKSRAISDIEEKTLDQLNIMVRGKIIQNLLFFKSSSAQSVPLKMSDPIWRRIEIADRKVSSILQQMGVSKYGTTIVKFERPTSTKGMNPEPSLLGAMQYVFEENDYLQEGILEKLFQLSIHTNRSITFNAFNALKHAISISKKVAIQLINIITRSFYKVKTIEHLYLHIVVLDTIFSTNVPNISSHTLHDIEFIGMIGLVSSQPITRSIAYKLLFNVDKCLDHRGISSLIHKCIQIAEKNVKERIAPKSNIDATIQFLQTLYSHYYEIWLMFLSELFSIVLSANYTPLLTRFGTLLQPILHGIVYRNTLNSPEAAGIFMAYLTSFTVSDVFFCENHIYRIPLYTPRTHKPEPPKSISSTSLNALIPPSLSSNLLMQLGASEDEESTQKEPSDEKSSPLSRQSSMITTISDPSLNDMQSIDESSTYSIPSIPSINSDILSTPSTPSNKSSQSGTQSTPLSKSSSSTKSNPSVSIPKSLSATKPVDEEKNHLEMNNNMAKSTQQFQKVSKKPTQNVQIAVPQLSSTKHGNSSKTPPPAIPLLPSNPDLNQFIINDDSTDDLSTKSETKQEKQTKQSSGSTRKHSFPLPQRRYQTSANQLKVQLQLPKDTDQNSEEEDYIKLIKALISSVNTWKDQLCFTFTRYVDVSFAGQLAKLFCSCTLEQMPDATSSLIYLLQSPTFNPDVLEVIRPQLISLFATLHSMILQENANAPGRIEWTQELERNVLKVQTISENYCSLLRILVRKGQSSAFPVTGKEITLSFIINWITTTIPQLKTLREKATDALVSLTKSGQILSGSPLYDDSFIRTFLNIELAGRRVLAPLLYYHPAILLSIFCEACLTSSSFTADLCFEALFVIFDTHILYTPSNIAALLLIGLIEKRTQHPKAEEFLKLFKEKICENMSYCAEICFKEGFSILKKKKENQQVRELITELNQFVPFIRLLPNQPTCTIDTPEKFRVYTPYQFLVSLMEVTETIDFDCFAMFSFIWLDLLKSPDHSELVPAFIMNWPNAEVKKNLLIYLVSQRAPHVFEKLCDRCTFAYYLHYTSFGHNVVDHVWAFDVLTKTIEMRTSYIPHIAPIIHITFIYTYILEPPPLLSILCKQFELHLPKSSTSNDLIEVVKLFIEKFTEDNKTQTLEEWGTEALKWCFGSNDIKIATFSFKVYNEIKTPLDETVIFGVLKTVAYFVDEYISDPIVLSELVKESFKFFSYIYPNHEQLAFDYASAFIDCPELPDSCRIHSTIIFIKSIHVPIVTKVPIDSMIPSIIRPHLSSIEQDEKSSQLFSILGQSRKIPELNLLIAPLEEIYGSTFIQKPSTQLIEEADETTLCKTIENYALMIDSASEQLADKIFQLTTLALKRAPNKNVAQPLARLYNAALNCIGLFPSAVEYIQALSELMPQAATKNSFEMVNWARTIEDVSRALRRLIVPDKDFVPITLTDCSTLTSVEALIGSGVTPKILPFSTEQDMLESMMKVQRPKKRKGGFLPLRTENSKAINPQKTIDPNWKIKPIKLPKNMFESLPKEKPRDSLFIVSDVEFDSSYAT